MSTYINKDRGKRLSIHSIEAPTFLKDYLNYLLSAEKLSENTVASYYVQMRTFLRWASIREQEHAFENFDPESFSEEPISHLPLSLISDMKESDIYAFLSFSQHTLKNSAASRKIKRSALHSFYNYYVNIKGTIEKDPTVTITTPQKTSPEPKYLSKQECLTLLDSVKGRYIPRDYCILTFFINCGMLLNELIDINVQDIQKSDLHLKGKGSKERTLYLNNACRSALKDWMIMRDEIENSEQEEALFISPRTGKRLCARQVQKIVANAMAHAGFSGLGYTAQTLRHTFAMMLYQNRTVDILTVQAALGHEDPMQLKLHRKPDQEKIRDAMKNSPLSDIRRT